MSEAVTEEGSTSEGQGGSTTRGDAPAADEFKPISSQEELNAVLKDRLDRERAKFKDYPDLKAKAAKLNEIEEAQKGELQKAIERAEAAERRASAAEFNSRRSKIAAAKGVPVSALSGETEDELNASADELLAWRGTQHPAAPQPKPRPESLKSGASGSTATESDPKVIAAEALRRFRNDL